MSIFYYYLFNNPFEFIFIVLVTGIVYYLLFKKYVFIIYDPLFLSLLFSTLATSVVFFLRINGEINTFYFTSYIVTQISFILGFVAIKPFSKKNVIQKSFYAITDEKRIVKILYFICVILFIVSQLITYLKLGIPIFNEAGRLTTYLSGGGIGILDRIIGITRPIILVYTLYKFSNSKLNLINKLVIIVYLITAFLSGSKSSILEIVFISVLYQYFQWKSNTNLFKLNRLRNTFASFAIIGAILIIAITATKGSDISPFMSLLFRFVNAGDVFMYSYTSNVLDKIPKDSGVQALFADFLGFTRIISYDKLPDALGLQIWQNFHNNFHMIMGPNPRHNVFGLHYFGFYGSIIYSFLIGLSSSFFRNSLYRILPVGILTCMIYVLFSPLVDLRLDATLQLKSVTNIIFIFLPILIFSIFMNEILKKKKTNKQTNKQTNNKVTTRIN